MRFSRPSPPPTRRAFSLLEATIVLGIVGLVVGAIWVAASTVAARQKVNKAIDLVLYTSEKARALVSASMETANWADIEPTLAQAGAAPADAIVGNQIQSPWGTSVTIGTTAGSVVQLDIAVPDSQSCIQMAKKLDAVLPGLRQSCYRPNGGGWTCYSKGALPATPAYCTGAMPTTLAVQFSFLRIN